MQYKELRRTAGESVTFEPVKTEGRPFLVQTNEHLAPAFWRAFRDSDLIVVGVTHMSGHTNVHVREAYE